MSRSIKKLILRKETIGPLMGANLRQLGIGEPTTIVPEICELTRERTCFFCTDICTIQTCITPYECVTPYCTADPGLCNMTEPTYCCA